MEAKQLNKKMESKGLKKLKYYCQMCKKQCSDANGFKCHLNSDQHKRQMRSFAEDSSQFLDEFSQTFESGMIELLKQKFFGKEFPINKIYMEYIKDKHHVHMNATRWSTLTEFAYHLERKGIVTCEKIDKGVLVTLVDRTQQTIEKQKQEEKRQRHEEKLKRMQEEQLQKQMEYAKQLENKIVENQIDQIKQKQQEFTGTIQMNLKQKQTFNQNNGEEEEEEGDFMFGNKTQNNKQTQNTFSFKVAAQQIQTQNSNINQKKTEEKKQLSENDEEEQEEQQINNISHLEMLKKKIKTDNSNFKKNEKNEQKSVQNSSNIKQNGQKQDEILNEIGIDLENTPWIQEGIVVKIKDKKLNNGEYYKKKGIIVKVEDEFVANLTLLDKPTVQIKIDQNFLETVIPKIQNKVMVLKPGPFCKKIGVLESLQKDNFSGAILLEDGTAVTMPYELFSKIKDE